ncbi:MAG: citramalate synthase [Parvibaculales bacterium]
MTKEKLYIFDTTLRDGQQTAGIDFSVEEKKFISQMLDGLGVDYIEGGYPGANPTDTEFFASPPKLKNAILTAFGMTKRAGRSASNDTGLATLLNTKAPAICMVAKSWDYHVELALGITLEENLASIQESVAAVKKEGREAMIDCEHFFDGYKANRQYALQCAKAIYEQGARWVVLCDTNGGTLPHEVSEIVKDVCKIIPGESLGIHAHNDTGNAVANSLVAIRAGVRQLQGTLNGLGERCGNADIVTLLPTLLLKEDFAKQFTIGVSKKSLASLSSISRQLDELLNRASNQHAPYVGDAAFAHKGGIHVSAVQKDPKTYEHIEPALVGNSRQILISDQAGRSNVLHRLKQVGITLDPKSKTIEELLQKVKTLSAQGYSYDGADASFELLVRRFLGEVPEYFTVKGFRVSVEYEGKNKKSRSLASVKLMIEGKEISSTGEGNGPVNALDMALRKDLGCYQKYIEDMRLVDFKVRILTSGTDAVTRVLIETMDGKGERWFTVGVSENIVQASFQALRDSLFYKLVKEKAGKAK